MWGGDPGGGRDSDEGGGGGGEGGGGKGVKCCKVTPNRNQTRVPWVFLPPMILCGSKRRGVESAH